MTARDWLTSDDSRQQAGVEQVGGLVGGRGRVGWGGVGVGGREAVDFSHGSFVHVHCCCQSTLTL